MLVTDIGDNYKMLWFKPFLPKWRSPTFHRCHQNPKIVANLKSPTLLSPNKISVEWKTGQTYASFRNVIKMTTVMFFALPLLNSEQDMVELLNIKNGMDEIDQSNRHEVQIPLHIRASHPALNFLHFFQKWIKPTLAEFVATFILIFWACMLQPPVRKITGTLILYSHL